MCGTRDFGPSLWMLLSAAAVFLLTGSVAAQVSLPDPLAIEIPVAGQNSIGADDSPLKELLESATSPGGAVNHDKAGAEFPLGPTLVTWSDGTSQRSEYVYVYPFGQTPVGSTLYERGTSGNGATNIVWDGAGRIHVAWLDAFRGVDQVMYRRGIQDPVTDRISWEIPPTRISSDANDVWNSMVGVAVSDGYVHFLWYGGDNFSYYRRLRLSDLTFEPIRNTGASGWLSDNGPDLFARSDDEIHVVTPSNNGAGGQYAVTFNGGISWTVESIPRPASGIRMKATAVTVDSQGNAHIVFPWQVRWPDQGFWELRYIRRTPAGVWQGAQYVLAQFPEWGDVLLDADPSNDAWEILSDWVDIAVDADDNLHVAWHGSVNTHAYANDESFYMRRQATGPGSWSAAWDPYLSLWPTSSGFSFAPSLSIDPVSGFVLPIVFYDTTTSYVFDSFFKFMQNGTWDGRPATPLTTMAADGYGLSSWFPCAAPRLRVQPSGKIWVDAVATDWPAESSADMIVVYQRREVTNLVLPITELSVGLDGLDWTALHGSTAYDVVRGDLGALRSSGGDFALATEACLVEDQAGTSLNYGVVPAPGEGFWMLVRGIDGNGNMTYDSLYPAQIESRDAGINAAGGACF